MLEQSRSVFELELVRPREASRFSVIWLEVESPSGSFVIGAGHSPLLSLLRPRSKLVYKTADSRRIEVPVGRGGILRVEKQKTIVLLEQ